MVLDLPMDYSNPLGNLLLHMPTGFLRTLFMQSGFDILHLLGDVRVPTSAWIFRRILLLGDQTDLLLSAVLPTWMYFPIFDSVAKWYVWLSFD